MLYNGTRDPLIQWNGGEIRGERGKTLAIEPMVQWWREVNGVSDVSALTETLPDRDPKDGCRIDRNIWQSAKKDSAPVVFYRAEGGGHALPSIAHPLKLGPVARRIIGPECREAEGAELAWGFFKPYTTPR
jgi:polyhydroxybutyrate depolymerase